VNRSRQRSKPAGGLQGDLLAACAKRFRISRVPPMLDDDVDTYAVIAVTILFMIAAMAAG
jgi:hypothetical protein